mgnify:CR=1 FL=1|tara:strand:+ start:521 stop:709 length:189 start_codon:yes stop_codon:yes gene_type:complete
MTGSVLVQNIILIVAAVVVVVVVVLARTFKAFFDCVTCPCRCIEATYKRCCSTGTGYSVQRV